MNYILRNFFDSVGLSLLLAALTLDPATAQFGNLLSILHSGNFWNTVGMLAMILVGLDLSWSGGISNAVEVVINVVTRLRDEGKAKSVS